MSAVAGSRVFGRRGAVLWHTPGVTLDAPDPRAEHEAWLRRQKKLRRAQDAGLVVLTLGVLLLAYVALVASGR